MIQLDNTNLDSRLPMGFGITIISCIVSVMYMQIFTESTELRAIMVYSLLIIAWLNIVLLGFVMIRLDQQSPSEA